MIDKIERTLSRAATSFVLVYVAWLAVLVGLGFLTAAAWIAISVAYDTLVAAVIIGCVYIALAAICLLVLKGRSGPKTPHRHPAERPQSLPPAQMPPLAQAFMFGMQAGMKQGGRPTSRPRDDYPPVP